MSNKAIDIVYATLGCILCACDATGVSKIPVPTPVKFAPKAMSFTAQSLTTNQQYVVTWNLISKTTKRSAYPLGTKVNLLYNGKTYTTMVDSIGRAQFVLDEPFDKDNGDWAFWLDGRTCDLLEYQQKTTVVIK